MHPTSIPKPSVTLQIRDLTGGYNPRCPVLHDLNFQVKANDLVGLIGLNGAGKSTTIKHILGLMTPKKGKIFVNGFTLAEDRDRYRQAIAYVPEQPTLYPNLTVKEHLRWSAMAYRVPEETAKQKMEKLAEDFLMTQVLNSLPQTLSKGMKQKVMLMSALLVEPALLIIDEPFVGLDPLAMRGLLRSLENIRAKGSAVLLSSHILATLEKKANQLVLLHKGRLIAQCSPQQLIRQTQQNSLEEAFETLVLTEKGGPEA